MELLIRNVSTTYPNGVQALKQVTLTVPQGIYGLLGPPGAGKSTLLRILATLQPPEHGSIRLDEIDVLKQKDELRGRIAYLPHGLRTEQRRDLPSALEENTVVTILDEPTAGLDPEERGRFLDRLREVSENRIVLIATRRVDDVREVCRRMAILNEGRILLEAEPLRAVADLQGRIWGRLIAKEALPRVRREYAVVSARPSGGCIVVRVYSNVPPAVGFEMVAPDLEDVYVSELSGFPGGVKTDPVVAGE